VLLKFEEHTITKTFKFGLLYCKENQTTEEQMFGNSHEDASKDFEQFLELLGTRHELQGFTQYAGGLDTKSEQTGKHSVFTNWNGNQIMFHVSTLLPHNSSDPQQIEKKRHIGNDIVLVVFQDKTAEPFSPLTVASHFIEVIMVVRLEKKKKDKPYYRIAVSTKKGLPPFPPVLPDPPVVLAGSLARDFILAKLINGELSAYKGPSFVDKIRTARVAMLDDLAQKFTKEGLSSSQGFSGLDKKQKRRSRTLTTVSNIASSITTRKSKKLG